MVIPVAKFHRELQPLLREELNPLFQIKEVQLINELPKTASNKIMRRSLRDEYLKNRDKQLQESGAQLRAKL